MAGFPLDCALGRNAWRDNPGGSHKQAPPVGYEKRARNGGCNSMLVEHPESPGFQIANVVADEGIAFSREAKVFFELGTRG